MHRCLKELCTGPEISCSKWNSSLARYIFVVFWVGFFSFFVFSEKQGLCKVLFLSVGGVWYTCGFSLNMGLSTLLCNVDHLDIFHFKRSHID